MPYTIGVDLGGTNIVAALADETGRLLARGHRPTAMPRSAEEIAVDIALCIEEMMAQSPAPVECVGIGTPGSVNPQTGVVGFANNLNFENTPLGSMIEKRVHCPVYLANDADAAALGEYYAGAGRGSRSMVAVTLGTGVGTGLVLDGRLYAGAHWAGGELGHTVICMDGEPCNCGRRGCWEAYSAAPALIRQTQSAMQAHPESKLWQAAPQLSEVSGKTVFQAVAMGDATAQAVLDFYVKALAVGLSNVVNSLDPDILCLGGGISGAGEALMRPLEKAMEGQSYARPGQQTTKLVLAQLGNDAGLVGAAMLHRQHH